MPINYCNLKIDTVKEKIPREQCALITIANLFEIFTYCQGFLAFRE